MSDRMQEILTQTTFAEASEEYRAFEAKFRERHAKTTDDCYTPPAVYEAVKEWVFREYGIPDDTPVVRPFYPGGDYEREEYPPGCIVLDNPPFSLLAKIVRFYMARKIRFFIFGPTLSLFTASETGVKYVVCGEIVEYDNGAKVNTSFLTSEGDYLIDVRPDLHAAIADAVDSTAKEKGKKLRKYVMPDYVVTSGVIQRLAKHGVRFSVWPDEALYVNSLDCGCELFGGAFLLSSRAAAERAAAERAAAERAAAEREAAEREAAEKVDLSSRELAAIAWLDERKAKQKEMDA